MTPKTKILLAALALVVAFAFGRFTSPEKVVEKVVTVEVEKKTDNKGSSDNENKHKKIIRKEVIKPDGTREVTETVVEDHSKSSSESSSSSSESTRAETKDKETTYSSGKTTVSGLIGIDVTKAATPTYGASVTRQVLGPFAIGIFGFTDGRVGCSIGLQF